MNDRKKENEAEESEAEEGCEERVTLVMTVNMNK